MMAQESSEHRSPQRPQATGRSLVLMRKGVDAAKIRNSIKNTIGIQTLDARDFGTSSTAMSEALGKGDAVVLPRFNVAVLPAVDSAVQISALRATDEVQQVRPEFYMFAIADPPFADTGHWTWGLDAVGVTRSAFRGRGIRVAVLDTGLDLDHPDFKGRTIVTQSFVGGTVQDVQGHGTHTAGTVAGPAAPQTPPRYGVAPDVELHIAKVLSDSGFGREGDILNGMNWAIDQKCVVISMSLGRATSPGEPSDPLYEEVGAAALAEDSLIIAAAGNESARDFSYIAPVGAPANSPSIMSVAAVDPKLAVAEFSCGGINPGGGEVDISGPGVSVYSSVPRPRLYRSFPGTSMACPHVAGVAALWAESDPSLRGQKLWDALLKSARELGNARDFGAGLVQAPGGGVGV